MGPSSESYLSSSPTLAVDLPQLRTLQIDDCYMDTKILEAASNYPSEVIDRQLFYKLAVRGCHEVSNEGDFTMVGEKRLV